jgi:hypothetical protein
MREMNSSKAATQTQEESLNNYDMSETSHVENAKSVYTGMTTKSPFVRWGEHIRNVRNGNKSSWVGRGTSKAATQTQEESLNNYDMSETSHVENAEAKENSQEAVEVYLYNTLH